MSATRVMASVLIGPPKVLEAAAAAYRTNKDGIAETTKQLRIALGQQPASSGGEGRAPGPARRLAPPRGDPRRRVPGVADPGEQEGREAVHGRKASLRPLR